MEYKDYDKCRETFMACFETRNLRKICFFYDSAGVYVYRYLGKMKYEIIFYDKIWTNFLSRILISFGLTETNKHFSSEDIQVKSTFDTDLDYILRRSYTTNNAIDLKFNYSTHDPYLPHYIYDEKEIIFNFLDYSITDLIRKVCNGCLLKMTTSSDTINKITRICDELEAN